MLRQCSGGVCPRPLQGRDLLSPESNYFSIIPIHVFFDGSSRGVAIRPEYLRIRIIFFYRLLGPCGTPASGPVFIAAPLPGFSVLPENKRYSVFKDLPTVPPAHKKLQRAARQFEAGFAHPSESGFCPRSCGVPFTPWSLYPIPTSVRRCPSGLISHRS